MLTGLAITHIDWLSMFSVHVSFMREWMEKDEDDVALPVIISVDRQQPYDK